MKLSREVRMNVSRLSQPSHSHFGVSRSLRVQTSTVRCHLARRAARVQNDRGRGRMRRRRAARSSSGSERWRRVLQ